MVYAISTLASLTVGAEGPHCRLRVLHQPVHPRLYGQSPDTGQEDHGLPFLGGADPGSDMGPVRSTPTLSDRAIAMPAGVALASTATTVPQRVASAGRSWN